MNRRLTLRAVSLTFAAALVLGACVPDPVPSGPGTPTTTTAPPTSSNVAALGLGHSFACQVTTGGTVQCFGVNDHGQLGNGNTTFTYTPQTVVGVAGAVQVSGSDEYACARLSDGTAKCWGGNDHDVLHNGQPGVNALTATPVAGLTGIVDIAAGSQVAAALLADGTVRCWGYVEGALNNLCGAGGAAGSVVTVPAVTGATEIDAGYGHMCALVAGGAPRCWGFNVDDALGGIATSENSNVHMYPGLTGLTSLTAGKHYSCAVTPTSGVTCWGGGNLYGQKGVPAGSAGSLGVVTVPGLTGVAQVSAGEHHACAVKTDHTVWCWGGNGSGQLNFSPWTGINFPPTRIGTIDDAVLVDASEQRSCVLTQAAKRVCWPKATDPTG